MPDNNIIRDEFPQEEGLIYLNHAGVAPWPARTRDAVADFARENVTYGASRYHLFNEQENRLRRQLKELINAPSHNDIALFFCNEAIRDELNLYQHGWHMTATPDDFDIQSWQPAASARRFEPGSSNMLGVHALSTSLSLIEELSMAYIEREMVERVTYLMERLAEHDRLFLVTPVNPRQRAGIVAFRVGGVDNRKLYRQLLEKRIVCAFRGGAIRFSPHYYNSMTELDKAIDIIILSI